jgi:hypothetical protein
VTDLPGFDVFESLIDHVFTFTHETDTVDLTLTSSEPRGTSPAGVPAGVLTFLGPREPTLPQATYTVNHPDLGDFALFVVPVAHGEGGTVYEAVFA